MRILHTADWHVGKVLKGHARHEEHRAVLASLVTTATEHEVDLVLVAGDVFEHAVPATTAQRVVLDTLVALAEDRRQVVVIAGNHDNPRQLDVYAPLLSKVGVTVVGVPRSAADGGRLDVRVRTGEQVRLGVLPFLSKRYAVSAAEAMANTAAENNRAYADQVARIVASLTEGFDAADAVNLLTTHATLAGATQGGGERESQVFDYYIHAGAFPASTHYVALGHLHRRQAVPGPAPLHYSGAPLPVDFGESENSPVAVVVDVTSDTPARTTDVPVTGGRRLRTLRGSLAELEQTAVDERDWLRVVVREPQRVGLGDEVRALLPGALEVRVDPEFLPTRSTPAERRAGRTPVQLFDDYLATRKRADAARLTSRFAELLDEVQAAPAEDAEE